MELLGWLYGVSPLVMQPAAAAGSFLISHAALPRCDRSEEAEEEDFLLLSQPDTSLVWPAAAAGPSTSTGGGPSRPSTSAGGATTAGGGPTHPSTAGGGAPSRPSNGGPVKPDPQKLLLLLLLVVLLILLPPYK